MLSLLGLLGALCGFGDNAIVINPYDSQCVSDTCVVLPLPVFRETTMRLAERNSLSHEVKERIVLDSALRVRIALDSVYTKMQDQQLTSCDQSIKDIRTLAETQSWKQTARGVGYGIAVTTVVYAILVLLGTR